jgi:putative transposase
MSKGKLVELKNRAEQTDGLTALIREGARSLVAEAVEAELAELLETLRTERTAEGRPAVVRNGYLPERQVQTGVGPVPVRVPKVRDRAGQGRKFNSRLIPPYLKRSESVDDFLPWLYLKGVSTGDFQSTLESLLGPEAKGLSAGTISRLKQRWEGEYDSWRRRNLSRRRYVYIWADGVYSNVRQDDRLCLLVLVGSDETGRKELLGLVDGYRESEASWRELLLDLESRGLTIPPKLAIGDGALGFWKAVTKQWPKTRHQRCWVHKTANVLDKLPKAVQPKVKEAIHQIWMAENRESAEKAYDLCLEQYQPKYPRAMNCLEKDRDSMLAFYDFPAEHWAHIRTTNPIESVFATVRLRTGKTKNCGSRKTTLAMAFKLMETAQSKWRRLRGYRLLADVIRGVRFKDGIRQDSNDRQAVA